MTLRVVSPEQALDLRDNAERRIGRAVREATRSFLSDVKDATLSGLPASPSTLPPSLTASSPDPLPGGEVPSLGDLVARWTAGMDAAVVGAIRAAFEAIWRAYTDQGLWLDSPAERAMLQHIAAVRDRLVRGTYFGVPVYEESFEAVRRALAQSVAEGWTRQALAQRIAAELSWETDGSYWRQALADTDHRIDSILDGIGPPGNPAREYARLHDPVVQALRNERNIAIRHLDAERSIWQTRANLIARTESTGVANAGAMEAFKAEGATKRMWTATAGGRTRLTHALASGQIANMGSPFIVGGATLMFPGDPNGPPEEVCNCRCCLVNPDNLTSAQTKAITDIADARSGTSTSEPVTFSEAAGTTQDPILATVSPEVLHDAVRPTQHLPSVGEARSLGLPEGSDETWDGFLGYVDDPRNAAHPRERIEFWREKIRNGETVPPIRVTRNGQVIDGHHRAAAALLERFNIQLQLLDGSFPEFLREFLRSIA